MKHEFLITTPDFHTCNSLQLSGTSAEKSRTKKLISQWEFYALKQGMFSEGNFLNFLRITNTQIYI